jgi:hypothetical protein
MQHQSPIQLPLVSIELRHLGGELRRTRPEHGALASIDAHYAMGAVKQPTTSFWTDQAYHRLRRIKTAIDPDDVIRSNHPVPPGSSRSTGWSPKADQPSPTGGGGGRWAGGGG